MRRNADLNPGASPCIQPMSLDVIETEAMRQVVAGVNTVFHLAAHAHWVPNILSEKRFSGTRMQMRRDTCALSQLPAVAIQAAQIRRLDMKLQEPEGDVLRHAGRGSR